MPSIETDVRSDLKDAADVDAVKVFADNIQQLLLAPPLGRSVVLGIDPGQRTGCKCVVVDDTGKLLTHALIQLVGGPAALEQARQTLTGLLTKYAPVAVAVGNGTHGRETADFTRDVLARLPAPADAAKKKPMVVLVSESGASVYSASEVASRKPRSSVGSIAAWL